MEVRKLQLIGGSSFMISLPKDWIRENTLSQGDELVVTIDGRYIKLAPKKEDSNIKRAQIEKILKYDDEFLFRFIQGLYIQGFDEIEITDIAVTPHITMKINEIAKRFIGMEIIHVGDEKIVLKCLTVPEMDSKSLLFRMAELVSDIMDSIDNAIMFKDLNELNTAMRLEDDTDRLYYLTTRYENKMAKYPVESDNKIIAKALEEIADSLMNVCLLIRSLREEPGEILVLLREIRNLFNSAFQAYAKKDLANAENVMNQLKKLQLKLNESPYPFVELYRCIKLIGEIGFNNAIKESVVEYL